MIVYEGIADDYNLKSDHKFQHIVFIVVPFVISCLNTIPNANLLK